MEKIELRVEGNGVAVLKMNDVETNNVFAPAFVDELIKTLEKLEELKPKVCILSGLSNTWAGGAEKQNLLDLCDGKIHVVDLIITEKLLGASFPIIAAMEGHAMGGGLVMATACDIVIAARESRYGAVFMSLGFTPGMGCTTLLPELVGSFIANEMMLTGKRFKGRELAEKTTNINYIVPKTEVMQKAYEIANQIAENNLKSIYLLKYTLTAPKKKLLVQARLQEDLMHKLSFAFPETRKTIEDLYA